MKTIIIEFLGLAVLMLACNKNPSTLKLEQVDLLVKNPTIIDVRTGSMLKDHSIIIKNGNIEAILETSSIETPPETKVVNAEDKYVIPGLWDVHTHIQNQNEIDLFFPLLIANGVLGIRDMGGLLPSGFKEGSQRHEHVPKVIAAGPWVDGPTPEGVSPEAIVDTMVARGADFLKIQSALPLDRLKAIAERANELGIYLAGHTPYTVSVGEASDIGLRSLEHYLEVYVSISEKEEELRVQHIALVEQEFSVRTIAFPPLEQRISTWSDEKAMKLIEKLVSNKTWMTPTHIDWRAWAQSGTPTFWDDELLNLLPSEWLDSWKHDQHFGFKNIPNEELPDYYDHIKQWYEAYIQLTKLFHKHGVKFLAGTDVSSWNFQVPGATLHDEIAIFVEAGLSPLEALQTATSNVADYLQIDGYDGTVSVGQEADFVILAADPIEDIHNLTKISAVVLDGNLIDKDEINKLLESAPKVLMKE